MVTAVRRTTGQVAAHRASVDETTEAVASFLIDLLGAALTAHIAGVEESTVRRWASGASQPQPDNEKRLRNASHIARLLLNGDANHTVRAWFIGMNPQLDDETPANVLSEDRFRDVMAAARAFVDGA